MENPFGEPDPTIDPRRYERRSDTLHRLADQADRRGKRSPSAAWRARWFRASSRLRQRALEWEECEQETAWDALADFLEAADATHPYRG